MALADYQQLVKDMVSDQDKAVTPDTRDRAIEQARVRYSTDLPRELHDDVTWPSLGVFGPVPEGWSDAARVLHVLYPIETRTPVYVDAYRMPAGGWGLECINALPAGAVVRVAFAVPHLLDVDADTIPAEHRLAVAQYAAHLLCQQLAARYSGEREAATGGDVARTESRARNFAARAKEYRSAYYQGTSQADPFAPAGSPAGGQAAAAAVVSWPGRRRHQLTRGVL
jgi:hypothetical protein